MLSRTLFSSTLRAARPTWRLTPRLTRSLSDEVRSAIDKAVGSSPVVLFMKGTPETPQCGFSRATIQILGLQGVDPAKFTAFNVLEDEALRQGIKEYSEWPTIPQLYLDKEFVGGCDILVAMHQSGELAKLLDDKKVLVEEKVIENARTILQSDAVASLQRAHEVFDEQLELPHIEHPDISISQVQPQVAKFTQLLDAIRTEMLNDWHELEEVDAAIAQITLPDSNIGYNTADIENAVGEVLRTMASSERELDADLKKDKARIIAALLKE